MVGVVDGEGVVVVLIASEVGNVAVERELEYEVE